MNLRKMLFTDKAETDKLSPSSRFNLRFMKRTNLLAIFIFVTGMLVKFVIIPLVQWLMK